MMRFFTLSIIVYSFLTCSLVQIIGSAEPLSSSPLSSPSAGPEPPAPKGSKPTRGECKGQDAGDKLRVGIKSRAGSGAEGYAGCRLRAARGDRLVVHYEGRFYSDCTVFDSTRPSIAIKTTDESMTETENSRTSSRGGGNVAKHGAVERGPFSFVLGEGSLIRGWEEGLVGMCVGEVRKLTVPRAMAYTRYADPEDSPMGKGLVYEIELLELHKP